MKISRELRVIVDDIFNKPSHDPGVGLGTLIDDRMDGFHGPGIRGTFADVTYIDEVGFGNRHERRKANAEARRATRRRT